MTKDIGWATNWSGYVGQYKVTMNVLSGCSTASVSYIVNVVTSNPCNTATLTIDPSVFGDPAFTYNVRAPKMTTLSWTDSAVTQSESTCGILVWELYGATESLPLSDASYYNIFTHEDLTLTTKEMMAYTTDISHMANYNMLVKVYYRDYTDVKAT